MKPFIPHQLPIKNIDWKALIPYLGPANRALSTFNGALLGIQHPEIFLSPLTMQEAVLSSKIEGTQATLGDVLKYEAGDEAMNESRVQDIQEILNYREALDEALVGLRTRPFNLNLLLDLHSVLLNSVRGRDKGRGVFRKTQNWIGRPNCPIEKAEFVPPDPANLLAPLDAWEKFYHAESPDPLAHLAVVHAQFEIIHPFIDGNGRLGRILIPLFLYERKLLSAPVFYLSAYMESNRDEYVDRLRSIGRRQRAWNEWIEFFLKAVTHQAELNAKAVQSVIALYHRKKDQVIGLSNSRYTIPVLDVLFERPFFSPNIFEGRKGLPSKPAVMALLEKMKQAGILSVVREARGSRSQILLFDELFEICEQTARHIPGPR